MASPVFISVISEQIFPEWMVTNQQFHIKKKFFLWCLSLKRQFSFFIFNGKFHLLSVLQWKQKILGPEHLASRLYETLFEQVTNYIKEYGHFISEALFGKINYF